jgi:radical SAM protein with 4Fe4S-binding SPASM domain
MIGQNLSSLRSFFHPRQVGYLIFYVTNRCNFRCEFCFYYAEIAKKRKPNELTLDEIDRLSRQIGPLLQLSLTGGEPFVRKDFAEIAHLFIDNCAVRYLTIPTNASLTDRMVRFLEDVLPRHPNCYLRLTFSIDGIGEVHDENRSMPGSYKKIQDSYAAIAPLRERFPNLVLDANSVFTAQSEDSILDTMKHLSQAFDFDNLSITFARGEIMDPALKTQAREKYIEVNNFLESLRRGKENRFLYPLWRGVRDVSRRNLIATEFDDQFVTPCVAGQKLLVISETGDVHPCEILDRAMGNLRDVDFDLKKIMQTPASDELRHWIKSSQCKCTFECALGANVVWNASQYPRMAVSALANLGKK